MKDPDEYTSVFLIYKITKSEAIRIAKDIRDGLESPATRILHDGKKYFVEGA
mgnify:CR=1 FL=1|tara:strand:+ start:755 stop:910 length:156 start_codon:yes stop_codon:yes gene_type:complete